MEVALGCVYIPELCFYTRILVSACQKSLFSPLSKFSELYKSSENLGFQWRRETGEAPPVADKASPFRGRLPISGYAVSADWLEPTVYPFLGFPRTPFLSVAENLPLYRQPHSQRRAQETDTRCLIQLSRTHGRAGHARTYPLGETM